MSGLQDSLATRLAEFSLNRKVTVVVLLLSTLVVGAVATLGIPLELFPRGYQTKFLRINVPWPDAPPQEVLDKITLPLEEELSTVKHLDGVNSWSSSGGAEVFLRFKPSVDIDVAFREVRDRIERAKLRFPDDVEKVRIFKDDPSSIPVAVIGLVLDPSITDAYTLVDKKIVLPLSRLDGVANVRVDGVLEKEVIIEVDRAKSEAYGLNIYELAQALGSDNFTLASGHVLQADKKLLLRSVATFGSLHAIENRPLNDHVRLKDIATVKYEEPEKDFSVRVNGKPAVAVVVFKEGEANTVELSKRLGDQVERMRRNPLFSKVTMEIFFDQGRMVESSIFNLVRGGEIGGVLAALVLYLFLRRARLTLIITLSIPLSLLISLIVMFFSGETLNMITILGLVICVGLLVDNSVVVAENIHRYIRDGLPRKEACIKGAAEIAFAITTATLTTVIVFLPVSLVQGEAQFFLLRLALPISVALVASLAVAIIFIPLSVYLTSRSADRSGPDTVFGRMRHRVHQGLNRIYDWTVRPVNGFYNRGLAFFLQHRIDLAIVVIAVLAGSFFIARERLELVPNQEEDRTSFRIRVEMPRTSGFEDTAEYFRDAEKVVARKVDAFGLRGFLMVHFDRGGRIEGWLDKEKPHRWTANEMAEKLLAALPKKPGVRLRTGRESQTEDAKGRSVFVVNLHGDNPEVLDGLAEQLEPLLLRVPGVIGVRSGNERAPNQLALKIDRDRANASHVNPEYIAGVVSYALRGRRLPRFHFEGREIPVRLRFRKEDRERLSELANFQVPTLDGGSVPVSALTQPRFLQVSDGVFRKDKRINKSLTLDLNPKDSRKAKATIVALERKMDLPEGVSFGESSSMASFSADLANMQFAGTLSILFIYLLMGVLFESFILPISIILTIPLAGIGVVWIHILTGRNVDVLGLIGAILLIGVVVNNGIVLIDYVNQLRKTLPRDEAIRKAADRRFRPILMTALTTIIGMIPLTVSKPNEMGLSYKSFGLTLIGGMSTATLLTLLVVPVFYTFFDDLREFMPRVLGVAGRVRSRMGESQTSG